MTWVIWGWVRTTGLFDNPLDLPLAFECIGDEWGKGCSPVPFVAFGYKLEGFINTYFPSYCLKLTHLFFPSQFTLQTLCCVQFRIRKWWRRDTCRRPGWHKPFKKRSTMMQRHWRGLMNRLHSKQISNTKRGRLGCTAIRRRTQGGRADYINTAGRGHWNWRLSILNRER